VNNLDRINAVAERSAGFVWRLIGEGEGAPVVEDVSDPRLIVNMSVWESVETLEDFVWKTVHKRIYERRKEWFGLMESMHFVMWWVDGGHQPSVAEAMARLAHFNDHGTSDFAFGWEGLAGAKLWREARCA
ncbi:MAG: DUF3291 domain-containing protein, partial [Alphaproteobacteria bacterium]